MLSVETDLRGRNDLRVGRKMATIQLSFQSREQVVVWWGQIRRIRVGDQDIGSPVRPVSSGLQVPGVRGNYPARTKHPWWNFRGVFLQNILQLHQQRCVILRIDSLVLWNSHPWRFWSAFRYFRTQFTERFRMSQSSWMMEPNHSRGMPRCSAIDLA